MSAKRNREILIEELEELDKKVSTFSQDMFDWVRCLNSIHVLQHLHDLQTEIRNKITEVKNVKEEEDAD